jgi:hypothetical protein
MHLGGAPDVDPKKTIAWLTTDDGKEFSLQTSRGWRDAHIAAGEAPEVAQGSADRSYAAYTAEPE